MPESTISDLMEVGSTSIRVADDSERPRCLVVEDNPVNRLLLGVLLERIGLEQVAVGCIEEATLRLGREAFDAVLLDVAMDGMAGLAAAGAIAALAGEEGPILLALGRGGLDDDALSAAGFAGVVESPVDADRLAGALIGALERRLGMEAEAGC